MEDYIEAHKFSNNHMSPTMDYIKIVVRNGAEVVSSYPVPLPY